MIDNAPHRALRDACSRGVPIVGINAYPYYRATFASVDGAGTLGDYPTLDDAIAACQRDRANIGDNPYGYRHEVWAQYGVYRDRRDCPQDCKWTSSEGKVNAS